MEQQNESVVMLCAWLGTENPPGPLQSLMGFRQPGFELGN